MFVVSLTASVTLALTALGSPVSSGDTLGVRGSGARLHHSRHLLVSDTEVIIIGTAAGVGSVLCGFLSVYYLVRLCQSRSNHDDDKKDGAPADEFSVSNPYGGGDKGLAKKSGAASGGESKATPEAKATAGKASVPLPKTAPGPPPRSPRLSQAQEEAKKQGGLKSVSAVPPPPPSNAAAEAALKLKLEEESKAKAEADFQARAKAQAEQAKAKAEAEAAAKAKAKAEEEAAAKAKAETEAKAKAEAAAATKKKKKVSDWEELVDESSGKTYYHNVKTDETSWTKPGEDEWQEIKDDAGGKSYWFNSRTGESSWVPPGEKEWIEHYDESWGRKYWVNAKSGESRWTDPDGGDDEDAEEWVPMKDDEGKTYYCSTKSGESRWSKPIVEDE